MRLRRLRESLPGITAITVLGLGLLTLFLGYDWFWMVFVLGWVVVTPLTALLAEALVADSPERTAAPSTEEDALALLRERYARGELDEDEFERRVDRLLATETVEEAREWAGTAERELEVEHE